MQKLHALGIVYRARGSNKLGSAFLIREKSLIMTDNFLYSFLYSADRLISKLISKQQFHIEGIDIKHQMNSAPKFESMIKCNDYAFLCTQHDMR